MSLPNVLEPLHPSFVLRLTVQKYPSYNATQVNAAMVAAAKSGEALVVVTVVCTWLFSLSSLAH
jgi:hypothetical protein